MFLSDVNHFPNDKYISSTFILLDIYHQLQLVYFFSFYSFDWKIRDWENCSESCGINGFRRRPIHCIQTLGGVRSKVDPSLCPTPQPVDHEECNREPCPAEWVTGVWTEVSWRGNDFTAVESFGEDNGPHLSDHLPNE